MIHNKTYTYEKTTSFVGQTIFSFQYSMVEVKYNSKYFYFIAFTYTGRTGRNGDYIKIKKFGFKSFSFDDINTYSDTTVTLTDNTDNRIVNLFALQDLTTLVLVYDKKIGTNNNNLTLKFYDYDLNEKGSEINLGEITIYHPDAADEDGVFFKSVELPGNKRAFFFIIILMQSHLNCIFLNLQKVVIQ